ncbi:MAG: M61 family metallopeptidase [Candidatus Eremiobacteraeota bacterium]|nr:M61 family metallopeptidase [Candidatus Eremiobacteraeota bacterium]
MNGSRNATSKVASIVTASFVACLLTATSAPSAAQTSAPLRIAVDASQAAQKIFHVKVSMPAASGPFTFVYPKWIPGYHGPVGPIEDVVGMHVSANGAPLEWRRDLVDMYAIHTTVPAGAGSVDVAFDVVGAESRNGMIHPISTSQLAILEYSNFTLYPEGATAEGTTVDASVTLPHGWTFGTALPVANQSGDTVTFARASLYTLIDSPIVAGAHERAFPLGGKHELDVSADSAAALSIAPKFLAGMKHLVAEGPALYGGEHYRDYHFLLTLSDPVGYDGIEHHESSDDRAVERYGLDDKIYRTGADLLPHEYSHSWNGKYRRPADLAVPDYQAPEKTDLLWVYEGLNQYNGEKLATRSRIGPFQDQLDRLAITAAGMDAESGRDWRPVRDTADGAPFLYSAPGAFYEQRRDAGDFYFEGDLIWLDADVTIRRLTHDAKSLDDFCKLWGNGNDTTSVPKVNPYDEAVVIKLLTQVVAYDWAGFFANRIDKVQPRAPLGGITEGGYRLVYTDKPSTVERLRNERTHAVDALYSFGANISNGGGDGDSAPEGTIGNILSDSPAFKAGLAPGMRLVAVDGRKWSSDVFADALAAHKGGKVPMRLIVANEDRFSVVDVPVFTGERYPHLERDPSHPDELKKIYAPKTFVPGPEPSEQPES